jgi:hypothetical protein
MGPGFNSTVYGICVYNGELYAGGDFTSSGSTPISYIAKWTGNEWISPGFTLFYHNSADYTYIHTLKVLNNKLIIAGGFDRAVVGTDTMHCTAVAAYNGTTLDTLNGGIQGKEAEALAIYQGLMIAGGGLNGSSYIASYDLPAGVENIQHTLSGINVFPNPTSSTINVVSQQRITSLSVTNYLGQVVYRAEPKDKNLSFNLDKEGIYLLSISSGNQTTTRKVVVSK